MFIFEITYPGTWLDYEDHDRAWKFQNLIRILEGQFTEASIALSLFNNERAKKVSYPDRNEWALEANRRQAIRKQLEAELEDPFDFERNLEIEWQIDIAVKREKWQSGIIPRSYENIPIFIYAKAFLYALDGVEKLLRVLTDMEGVPDSIKGKLEMFKQDFPQLRGVRNTVQHLEDRMRGLGTNGKPLHLKPIENRMVHAPNGGVLILNSINGTLYGSTMGDGQYGEVDVSMESMLKLQNIFQDVINCFKWKGPKSHYPM